MWQKLVSYLLTTTFLPLYASLKSSSATKVAASVILVFRFHPSAVFNSRFHIIALPESALRTFFVFSNSLRVSNYPLCGGQVGGVMNRVKARFVVFTATSSRNRDIVIYRREPVEECECFQIIFRITNLYLECSDTITGEVRKSYLSRGRYFYCPLFIIIALTRFIVIAMLIANYKRRILTRGLNERSSASEANQSTKPPQFYLTYKNKLSNSPLALNY